MKTTTRKLLSANSKGFSLVEIMIVLAVIGIIVGIMATNFSDALEKAKFKATKVTISQVADRLEMYRTDCGDYPTTEEGLEALVTNPGGSCEEWGPESYMDKIPRDQWKREFVYESDGSDFTITSLGADRKEGGKGYDADISNREAETEE